MNVALLAVPLVLAATAAPAKLPTAKPHAKPKVTKPLTGANKVETIPAMPAGLELLYVPAHAFTWPVNDARIGPFGVYVEANGYGRASAHLDLPAHATIDWVDCRVDRGGGERTATAKAQVQLSSADYADLHHSKTSDLLLSFPIALDAGASKYWAGKHVDAKHKSSAVTQPDRVFVLWVEISTPAGTPVTLRGCRIGYRT